MTSDRVQWLNHKQPVYITEKIVFRQHVFIHDYVGASIQKNYYVESPGRDFTVRINEDMVTSRRETFLDFTNNLVRHVLTNCTRESGVWLFNTDFSSVSLGGSELIPESLTGRALREVYRSRTAMREAQLGF